MSKKSLVAMILVSITLSVVSGCGVNIFHQEMGKLSLNITEPCRYPIGEPVIFSLEGETITKSPDVDWQAKFFSDLGKNVRRTIDPKPLDHDVEGLDKPDFQKRFDMPGATGTFLVEVQVNDGEYKYDVSKQCQVYDPNPEPTPTIPPPPPCLDESPRVSATMPEEGAKNIRRRDHISVVFSEEVTLKDGWFQIWCERGGMRVAAEDGGPAWYTLQTSELLPADDVCTITIFGEKVLDRDDKPPKKMDGNFTLSFTTEAEPEYTLAITEVHPSACLKNAKGSPASGSNTYREDIYFEFIELYNYSPEPVSIENLRLITSNTGSSPQKLVFWEERVDVLPGSFMEEFITDRRETAGMIPGNTVAVVLDPDFIAGMHWAGDWVPPYHFPEDTVILTVGSSYRFGAGEEGGLLGEKPGSLTAIAIYDDVTRRIISTYGTPSMDINEDRISLSAHANDPVTNEPIDDGFPVVLGPCQSIHRKHPEDADHKDNWVDDEPLSPGTLFTVE
jgi:hypothetical protein